MTTANKRKGSGAERDVVVWLHKEGFKYAARRVAGSQLDKGDISGVEGVTIEVKNQRKLDLAGWVKELEIEMKNDGAWTGTVLHKKKGTTNVGEWYATMPASVWIALIRKVMGR